MAVKVYPADKVDTLLKAASEAMHGIKEYAASVLEQNVALQRKIERMPAKEASNEKVILEKVASVGKIAKFVSMLEDRAIIPVGSREKYAAACAESPDAILDIATQALKLSESPATQGRGIKSAASYRANEKDDELREEMSLWLQTADSMRRN